MYPKKDNTLSLLGGAVLGAVAMYLLDPEAGARRRRQIAETTGEAAHTASERLQPILERVGDTARNVGLGIAGGATALGHGVAERYEDVRDSRRVRHFGDHVSDLGHRAAERFRRAGLQARKGASAAAAAPSQWFRREEESHAGAYAATGLGTLVLGAGLMYMLDPQRGRGRRALAMDKARSIVNRTGRTFRQVGQDLRNRTRGYAHEARGMVGAEDAVSAERLLQRVRAEMGHVVSHAGMIQVMTDNHGRVTLHGKVLAPEVDPLVACVKGVGGVTEVINLLAVKNTDQEMHEQEAGFGTPQGASRIPQL
jgi:osmotically-inducible protein OsmY